MNRLIRPAALLLGALIVIACGGSNTNGLGEEPIAFTRFFHAAPAHATVDVLQDGELTQNDVALGSVPTTYREVELNQETSARSETGLVLAFEQFLRTERRYYTTLLIQNSTTSFDLVNLEDDTIAPPPGNVRARFVHALSGTGNVDVYITTGTADLAALTPSAANLAFKSATNLAIVSGTTVRVRLTTPGTKTVLADSAATAVPANTNNLFVLYPNAAGAPTWARLQ